MENPNFYESRDVAKGRKVKWCSNESCGKKINIGEPSITITMIQDEFIAYPVCSKECEEKFISNYNSEDE